MADYPCDAECGNLAAMSITNFGTSETGFYCGRCFGVMGAVVLHEMEPETLAAMVTPVPAEQEPPTRKRGRKIVDEPYPINEPVATIIEDQPRPPSQAEGAPSDSVAE